MKTLSFWLIVATMVGGVAIDASAQQRFRRHPRDRPTISPYLSLIGRGADTFAGAYFRGVRPELQLRQADRNLASAVQRLESQVEENRRLIQSPTSGLSPTGHSVTFGPNTRYFGNRTAVR